MLEGTEWILHAATQDLPCLAELGLVPTALFDTELAGRLLGYPRVGLATLVETLLGRRLAKEHSAVDWSTRPLPRPWLEYAALDVEVLVELRDVLARELVETGKDEWARQEFECACAASRPTPRVDAWRRTSGVHRVRGRRGRWAPSGRCGSCATRSPASATSPPAGSCPTRRSSPPPPRCRRDRRSLLRTQGFHGRGAARYAAQWVAALQEVAELPEEELPTRAPRGDGPPLPRAWAEKDPVAARRLALAREAVTALSEERRGAGREPAHPRPTCAGCSGRRRRPATPEALAGAVDAQLAGSAPGRGSAS